jgi:hypothetical protein
MWYYSIPIQCFSFDDFSQLWLQQKKKNPVRIVKTFFWKFLIFFNEKVAIFEGGEVTCRHI